MNKKKLTIWATVEPQTEAMVHELADKTKRTLGGTLDWVIQTFYNQEIALINANTVNVKEPAVEAPVGGNGNE